MPLLRFRCSAITPRSVQPFRDELTAVALSRELRVGNLMMTWIAPVMSVLRTASQSKPIQPSWTIRALSEYVIAELLS